MQHLPIRLAAGALLALSMSSVAFADPQAVQPSEAMQAMLKQMHADKYSSLSLLDEQGAPMDSDAFAQELKAGHRYKMKKQAHPGGDPDFTMQLVSKDAPAAAPAPALKAGDAFPAFHLNRLDGSAVDNAALAGRYTLVSFYFATCAPCIKEVPDLNALAERRKDINVLAVTFDTPEESRRFVDEHHLNWPVVAKANSLIHEAGVRAYPTLVLLDPQGKVVDRVMSSQLTAGGGIGAWLDQHAAPAQ